MLAIGVGIVLLAAFFNVVIPASIMVVSSRVRTIATLDTTWLTAVYAGTCLYYFYLLALSWRWRQPADKVGYTPYFVCIVPARNEAAVIEQTIESLLALDYEGHYRVLVMDDGSTDRTGELAAKYTSTGKVAVVHRDASVAGRGKGDVLNHAYRVISQWHLPPEDTVVTILDADGRLEADALSIVAPYFACPVVGSVQVAVRIYNAGESLLTRLQDMEFIGFSMFMQMARDASGSVGLGGNGQFVRLSALQSLGQRPWSGCLTEDLDIGIRLALQGWKLRFCSQAFVAQHGVLNYKALLRQRTRWMQGTYQCWHHIPKLLSARGLNRQMRTDYTGYLLMASLVFLIGINLGLNLLAFAGVSFGNGMLAYLASNSLPAYYGVSSLLSLGPLSLLLISFVRNCREAPTMTSALFLPAALALYTYAAWVPAGVLALLNIMTNRTGWIKTPRIPA